MDEITPVFVCGMGRSGTTNALRVLNTHPLVALNGEISLSVLRLFFATLDGADRSYLTKAHLGDGWNARKAEYIFESFGYLSKSGRGRLSKMASAKFRGHKSPRLESLFEKYEAHFDDAGAPPRYFYCARNPFDCWRSYRAMPWTGYGNVQEFLEDYVASFTRSKQMQEVVAERVVVLNLDELKRAPDLLAYYREKIFSPLGLDMLDKTAERIAKLEENRKSTSAPELSNDEKTAIANHPGIAELIDVYFPPVIS